MLTMASKTRLRFARNLQFAFKAPCNASIRLKSKESKGRAIFS